MWEHLPTCLLYPLNLNVLIEPPLGVSWAAPFFVSSVEHAEAMGSAFSCASSYVGLYPGSHGDAVLSCS